MKRINRTVIFGALLLAAAITPYGAQAAVCSGVCDGETAGNSNTINGATFYTNNLSGSVGTGVFPAFVKVQGQGQATTESGYNTLAAGTPFLDAKVSPMYMPQIQNLGKIANPVAGLLGDFYEFRLDINESTGSYERWLSLDEVQICTASSSALGSASWTNCGALGGGAVERYNMDTVAVNSTLLMDYFLNSGSGNGVDIQLFIPTSVFSGAAATDFIYLYSSFGAYGTTGSDATTKKYGISDGSEEWAFRACVAGQECLPPVQCEGQGCFEIPTVGTLPLIGASLISVGFLMRRRRQPLQ